MKKCHSKKSFGKHTTKSIILWYYRTAHTCLFSSHVIENSDKSKLIKTLKKTRFCAGGGWSRLIFTLHLLPSVFRGNHVFINTYQNRWSFSRHQRSRRHKTLDVGFETRNMEFSSLIPPPPVPIALKGTLSVTSGFEDTRLQRVHQGLGGLNKINRAPCG